jgi:hypothetical protein
MKRGKARTAYFNTNGTLYKTKKNNAANSTVVGKTAVIPIQDKSRFTGAEELAWLASCPSCPCASGVLWIWQATMAPRLMPMSHRATIRLAVRDILDSIQHLLDNG